MELQRPLNSSGDCVEFWEGQIWLQGEGCGYGVIILTMEEVGGVGVGQSDGFGGSGQGEINGQQQDDHR